MKYYIYILKGDRHYIGYTVNLENRMKDHKLGRCKTTKRLKVYKLLGYFEKETKTEAMKLESIIKKNGHIDYWISHASFIKVNREL